MKKILALLTALVMTFTVTVFAAVETDEKMADIILNPVEVGPNSPNGLEPTIPEPTFSDMSARELLQAVNLIMAAIEPVEVGPNSPSGLEPTVPEPNFSNMSSMELLAAVEEIINELYPVSPIAEGVPKSEFEAQLDVFKDSKRLELLLDLNEGLTLQESVKAYNLSTDAISKAEELFPSMADPARHFIWSYNMAQEIGVYKSRTVGINHEWGRKLTEIAPQSFEVYYNYYIGEGKTETDAIKAAADATINEMFEYKRTTINKMQEDKEEFFRFFDNSSIMDLWNNCYGRAYVERGYSTAAEAFAAALEDGTIILSESELADWQKDVVWINNWYTY